MRDNVEDIYELTPLQRGMLFHTLLEPNSGFYIEQVRFSVHAQLATPTFCQAWQQVVNRTPVLRTSFHWQDLEDPLQVVHRRVTVPFEEHDWRGSPPDTQRHRLEAYLHDDRVRGFDVEQAPLLRLAVFLQAEASYTVVVTFHHILLDGWSLQHVLSDVGKIYAAYTNGVPVELENRRPFGDYIAWLQVQDLTQAQSYWRSALSGFAGAPPLVQGSPASKPAHAVGHGELETVLTTATTFRLREFCRANSLTLNTVAQGAWAVLLARYGGEDDVMFGSVVSGRSASLTGVESVVGLLTNTIPVRVQVCIEPPVVEFLERLQADQVEMRQYEHSPLTDVHGWSGLPRNRPLFESLLVFENFPTTSDQDGNAAEGVISDIRAIERNNYPLTLLFVVVGSNLWIKMIYDPNLFAASTVDRLIGHFVRLLEAVAADPYRPVGELEWVSAQERYRLMTEFNATEVWSPQGVCVHELFEAQVGRTPTAVAVVGPEGAVTYAELNRRANRLAGHLMGLGVGPGVMVGACLERSVELVVALLGVLKAGGAYVPLDPAYPPARLGFMLADSATPVLVTHRGLGGRFDCSAIQVVDLDRDAQVLAGYADSDQPSRGVATDLAYVIYTSGSTGTPKGVMTEHRSVVNRLCWMWQEYPFSPGEVCCVKTRASFVDSVWELFGPLLQGVRCVLVPDSVVCSPAQLVEMLSSEKVTRIVLVPSLLRALLDLDDDQLARLSGVTTWVSSGEVLPSDLAAALLSRLPGSRVLNLYGCTEVMADATCFEVSAPSSGSSVAIGRPIANTRVYVLDGQRRLVPVGVPGELYVGGAGVARGYLGRPELTADRFVADPFGGQPGARLYRTGDRVRWSADGNLEFLGRVDAQVNLRGFRVEPGEVEAALSAHPQVKDVAVVPHEDPVGDMRLVAYAVATAAGLPEPASLRGFLREHLPEYMVPSGFVELDQLPLSPAGKVDRVLLAARNPNTPVAEVSVSPRTAVEEAVAEAYREVLGRSRVGVWDDFFALGGHSLLATKLVTRLNARFQVELALRVLFETPTVAGLAVAVEQALRAGQGLEAPPLVSVKRERGIRYR